MATILLAISFGFCAGFLDLGALLFKKYCWNSEGYFRNARDFPWTVPVGHAALMVVPGVVVTAVNRVRPGLLSLRAVTWFFATLAIWSALLRMPLYGVCSLLLGAGLGRLIGDAVAPIVAHPRRMTIDLRGARRRRMCPGGALVGLAVGSGIPVRGRTSSRAPGARNVVLIVWDTVRAYNLSIYGYFRNTTPNLPRWAWRGVTYKFAMAPAPWTFPSHACFFTGQWPHSCRFAVEIHLGRSRSHTGRIPVQTGLSDWRIRGKHKLLHL